LIEHMETQNRKRGKIVTCLTCGEEIYKSLKLLDKTENHFCSRSCAITKNNGRRRGDKHGNYKNGGCSYRRLALETFENKCSNPVCPLQNHGIIIETKLLDVDHIDSDRTNNAIENLQILCVYCHAVKTRITE
jgi:hypothetical protein